MISSKLRFAPALETRPHGLLDVPVVDEGKHRPRCLRYKVHFRAGDPGQVAVVRVGQYLGSLFVKASIATSCRNVFVMTEPGCTSWIEVVVPSVWRNRMRRRRDLPV